MAVENLIESIGSGSWDELRTSEEVELFCHVDDFCPAFEGAWFRPQRTTGSGRRRRAGRLCLSEIRTRLILFHPSPYRPFKAFYQQPVGPHLRGAFPGLVSYGRFVELIPSAWMPLCAYLRYGQGPCLSFIDSTPLAVCHPRRRQQHRLFADAPHGAKAPPVGFLLQAPSSHQ